MCAMLVFVFLIVLDFNCFWDLSVCVLEYSYLNPNILDLYTSQF